MRGRRSTGAGALALALASAVVAPAQAAGHLTAQGPGGVHPSTTTSNVMRASPGGSISVTTTGTLGWAGDTVTTSCMGGKVTGAGASYGDRQLDVSTRLSDDGSTWTVTATKWLDGAPPADVTVYSGCTPETRVFPHGGNDFSMNRTVTVAKAGDTFVVDCLGATGTGSPVASDATRIGAFNYASAFPSTVQFTGAITGDSTYQVTVDSIEGGPANITVGLRCVPCP